MALIAKYHPILNKFEHQNVAKIMDSQRFELQNAAMPLKWQFPASICCDARNS